ncbi:hypothetical protein HYDPIDRAFT_23575 [Hydnomerulius pinastri MD-312]|nr:hypothetical protein HYDPIDRAFT_23575 [Hydnomerulius pinastri MD-312]
MDSRQLIDAQFDRAVEIVQSLPKTGPIQTGYEEKLTMYSLYKQATVGNVTSPRPGIFEMLNRAKWDAWAKHKDLDSYEAKWLYVDALLKALSKYSDKTVAKDLIDELQSYGGDPDNLVLSHTLTRSRSRGSESSGSTASEEHRRIPPAIASPQYQDPPRLQYHESDADGESSSEGEEGETGDEARDLPMRDTSHHQPRPLSSVSLSSRYRTPLTGSFAISSPPPPRRASVPPQQPLPNFETPSAFADPQSASIPSSSVYPSSTLYTGRYPSPSRDMMPQIQSALPYYNRGQGQPMVSGTPSRHYSAAGGSVRPPSRALSMSLEQAVENVQAHLAALTERIDTLESTLDSQPLAPAQRSTTSLHSRGSSGRGSPARSHPSPPQYPFEIDFSDIGLWSLILKPLLKGLSSLHALLRFFLRSDQQGNRGPVLMVVRRLCLDISFVLGVLGVLRVVWKRSGVRRREVGEALGVLWGAVLGKRRKVGGR